MTGDFALIRAICQDPNYQRNPALGLSMQQFSGVMRNTAHGLDAADVERVRDFWGLTGETFGAVWKAPLSMEDCDLEWWLDRIEFESRFVLGESGIDFQCADRCFEDRSCSLETPSLDAECARCLADFLAQHRRPLWRSTDDIADAISRFTVSYLLCYRAIEQAAGCGSSDWKPICTALAECYGTQARLRGVVLDAWVKLEIKA